MRRLLLFTSFLFSTLGDQTSTVDTLVVQVLIYCLALSCYFSHPFIAIHLKPLDKKCGMTFTIRDYIPNIVNLKRMFKFVGAQQLFVRSMTQHCLWQNQLS